MAKRIKPAGSQPVSSQSESGRKPSVGRVGSQSSLAATRERARRILAELKKLYLEADCALQHGSALHLLIATILSAQSTDDTVNKVTPVLFQRYPTAEALAQADPAEVERIVYPTGFFRQKTRSIIGTCQAIAERFGGQAPDRMEDLVQLPGVARKTANVVLGTWFGQNVGVVVDTHVGRLAHRLGLTWSSKDDKDAVRIEQDLMQVLPQPEWTYTSHALIWHGRRVCAARKPACDRCTLSELCPSAFSFDQPTDRKTIARTARKSTKKK